MKKLHTKNWPADFVPDSYETGEPESVRWAQREVMGDADWTKWHATDGNANYTACGRLIIPFMQDGSPQFADLGKVECRQCQKIIKNKRPDHD